MRFSPTQLAFCLLIPAIFLSPESSAQSIDGPALKGTTADTFLADHGDHWTIVREPASGNPSFIYGSRFLPDAPPLDLADYEAAARQMIDAEPELLGVPSRYLELEQVRPLPLSRIGSSDKVVVTFRQVVDDIPVQNGFITILFERYSGAVLAIDTTAVPNAHQIALDPVSPAADAVVAARAAFQEFFGVPASRVNEVRATIVGASAFFGIDSPLNMRGAALAYVMDIESPGYLTAEGIPATALVWVSAEGDLTVFKVEPTTHAASTGTVAGNVNTGPEPNTTTNQEQPFLGNLWLIDAATGQVAATTAADGSFSVTNPAVSGVRLRLQGPFANVNNLAGKDARLGGVLSPTTPISFLFNPSLSEFTTAEVAAYYWVNEFHSWIKQVSPEDDTMDVAVSANVNHNADCNAYYSGGGFAGGTINFFTSGSGCANTSYKPVVHHEEGHYANVAYNGTVSGAFHEGAADAWTYFIADDPCLHSFLSSGGCLRHGDQTSVKKCPTDGDESCHGGETHKEGQALASALWAVRKNLKTSFGTGPGGAVADTLFLSWFQTYKDKSILNVINDHWIALDDDNGDLNDLTPHFAEINDGFISYNWPGVVVPDLVVDTVNVPPINGSVDPLQPVTIEARMQSNFGTVTATELYYSTDNGANYMMLPMTPTGQPDRFAAAIPGQPDQTSVRWYLRITGSLGGSLVEPAGSPDGAAIYHCGLFVPLAFFDFDNFFSDEGWTHVKLSGTYGDQWERSNPSNPQSNEETDPDAPWSGFYIWGTDLSVNGTDGKYEPNCSGELRSPLFDLSGSLQVRLQYRRWLTVEESNDDQATISVNSAVVWQNPATTDVLDTEWVLHDLDISAQAAGNPAAQVIYRMTSDGGTEYGGWNLDDFLLYRIDPMPAAYFQPFGAGCPGTFGKVPALSGSGVPSPGGTVTISVGNGLLAGSGLLFIAFGQGVTPLGGGCDFLLAPPILGGGINLNLSISGAINLTGPVPPAAATGDAYLQFVGFDPGSPNGQYTVSNGLKMHIE